MSIDVIELERRMKFAREVAARIWCTPETQHIQMDVILAEAIAKVLVVEMYEPHLGCATTKELLDEVAARVDLDYSTIKCDEIKS